MLRGWAVPSLRGIEHWSENELVAYLGSGRNSTSAVAGEMTDVIANSTSYMTDEDLHPTAAYLKSLAGNGQAVYQRHSQSRESHDAQTDGSQGSDAG